VNASLSSLRAVDGASGGPSALADECTERFLAPAIIRWLGPLLDAIFTCYYAMLWERGSGRIIRIGAMCSRIVICWSIVIYQHSE